MKILYMGIALLLLVAPVIAQEGNATTPEPEPADLLTLIEEAVAEVPHLKEVVSVEIVEVELDDDTITTLEVTYITTEIDEIGYRAEIMEVYRVIGGIITAEDAGDLALEIEEVLLMPSVTPDQSIEFIACELDILRDFMDETINRTAFLEALTVTFTKGGETEADEV